MVWHRTTKRLTYAAWAIRRTSRTSTGGRIRRRIGQLESLHAELVVRFAAEAATSNYQIVGHPAAMLDTENARVRHMLERFHTPFCLNEFRPHVTVLGDFQEISVDEARVLVANAGGQILEDTETRLRFGKICLMKRERDGSWRL